MHLRTSSPPSQMSTIAAGLWQQMERKIYFDMLTVGYRSASSPVSCLLPPTAKPLHSVYRPTN